MGECPVVVKRSLRGDVGSKKHNPSSSPRLNNPRVPMFRPARLFTVMAALATTSGAASTLSAQAEPVRRADSNLPRGYGDINFAVSQPLGAFNEFTGEGYGLTGGFVWHFDGDRVFGIRAEGGFVQYGNERTGHCLINCRIGVDINTSNDIAFGGICPQISVPSGPLRPYLNAT